MRLGAASDAPRWSIPENIKFLTSSVSSVVLPIIESLGDEDELSLIDSER